jgi:hypothetical protein
VRAAAFSAGVANYAHSRVTTRNGNLRFATFGKPGLLVMRN